MEGHGACLGFYLVLWRLSISASESWTANTGGVISVWQRWTRSPCCLMHFLVRWQQCVQR